MTLRPLLDIAVDDERFGALIQAVRDADGADVHMSAAIRPYLLAVLVSSADGLGERPALIVAPDDIAARDLARDLAAYLAPQRVRYYPSRGTGYASHLAPPPHLVGLRIAALDSLSEGSAVVVASAAALAEAVPDTSLRPAGLTLRKGEEVDLGEVGDRLVEAGYEHTDQVEERGQFAIRGGILDVFPATEDRAARVELFGDEIESIRWFSTFTQRSLGEAEQVELSPAAELASEHRELAELALEEDEEERPDLAELLPLGSFRPVLDLIPSETAIAVSEADQIQAALRDHWDDVIATMPDADARRLYVDVAAPLAERASLQVHRMAADSPAVEAELGDPQAAGDPANPDVQAEFEFSFRAQAPTSAARSIGEAEALLERELRSGYR